MLIPDALPVQVWDLRNFKHALHVFTDLPATYSSTQCCYSPDERLILTGGYGASIVGQSVQVCALCSPAFKATSVPCM